MPGHLTGRPASRVTHGLVQYADETLVSCIWWVRSVGAGGDHHRLRTPWFAQRVDRNFSDILVLTGCGFSRCGFAAGCSEATHCNQIRATRVPSGETHGTRTGFSIRSSLAPARVSHWPHRAAACIHDRLDFRVGRRTSDGHAHRRGFRYSHGPGGSAVTHTSDVLSSVGRHVPATSNQTRFMPRHRTTDRATT
jgi:hypothetical protein